MSIHTTYKFRHFRSLEPGNPDAPRELIWASTLGELDEGIRKGSLQEQEIIHSQEWIENALADAGEQSILDVWFRASASVPTFYFALFNDTPVDTDTPATLTGEVTGTGYARISVARNTTDWPTLALDAGDYQVTSATKTFSAGGTWTSATQLCLMSDASGTTGSFWAWAALSATRTLQNGDTLDVSMAVKLS